MYGQYIYICKMVEGAYIRGGGLVFMVLSKVWLIRGGGLFEDSQYLFD